MNARDLRDFERDPSKFAARVKREKSLRQKHKLRLRAKSSPRRHAEKADRESRKAKLAEVRKQRLEFAGNRCELSGPELHCADLELHHVFQGSTKRLHEALGEVVIVCRYCHRALTASHGPTWAKLAEVPGLTEGARRECLRRAEKWQRLQGGNG